MDRVSVGFSQELDDCVAGKAATRAALSGLKPDPVHLLLVFATSKHDHKALVAAVRAEAGSAAKLVSACAVGVATHEHLGYGGTEVGVVAFHLKDTAFDVFGVQGLDTLGEFAVGHLLGQKLLEAGHDLNSQLMVFYDSIRGQDNRPLNMATPLIEGLRQHFQPENLPELVGMGCMGDMTFGKGCVGVGEEIHSQSAALVGLKGRLKMETCIIHGCKPASDYHTITRSEGAVVLEIDHRPAAEAISDLIGWNPDLKWENYPLYVTLGVNKGPSYEFKEEFYANRLCMDVQPETGGLVMFEPDLRTGDRFQLMRRNISLDYVHRRVRSAFQKVQPARVVLALYINCIGRAAAYSGTEREDVDEVRRVVPKDVPFLAVYSGVEIAKMNGGWQSLDWTGVLVLFCESGSPHG